jgi:hypothetical protein
MPQLLPARLPAPVEAAMSTPVFQRLRWLRQAGLARLLFPRMDHTRFEHAVGTARATHTLLRSLAVAQPELEITSREAATAVLAAACRDLGRGPCAQVFERFMAGVDPTWCPRAQSVRALRQLVSTVGVEQDVDVDAACDMITHASGRPQTMRAGREFLFDIVADAGALDGLARDYARSGLPVPAAVRNAGHLLHTCRVVAVDAAGPTGAASALEQRLGWPARDAAALLTICRARQAVHSAVFQHPRMRAMEHMVLEALRAADPAPFAAAAANPASFLHLTDWAVDVPFGLPTADPGGAHLPGVAAALRAGPVAALFADVARGRLWEVVGRYELQPPDSPGEVCAETARHLRAAVFPDRFHVDLLEAHCGKGASDPMGAVRLFDARGRVLSAASATVCVSAVGGEAAAAPFHTRTLIVFCKRLLRR